MNQEPPIDDTVAAMRHLTQKAYLTTRVLAGSELLGNPNSSSTHRLMTNPIAVLDNQERELQDRRSDAQRLIIDHLSTANPDVFELQAKGKLLGDTLLEGTESLDVLDFVLAIRSYRMLENKAGVRVRSTDTERIMKNGNDLSDAFALECVSRMAVGNFLGRDDIDIATFYDKVVGGTSKQSRYAELLPHVRREVLQRFKHVVGAAIVRDNLIGFGRLFSPGVIPVDTNPYNKRLSQDGLQQLNDAAAGTIERLHLLGIYSVSPIILPHKTVALPWDIAVLPAVDYTTETYEEGAIADFYFLPPDDERTVAVAHVAPGTEAEENLQVRVGATEVRGRLRLHHNGQISSGVLLHRVAGDTTEVIFNKMNASPAFARLRALLCAVACDSMVPDDVLRERMGGSVAERFRELQSQPRTYDPFTALVLSRQRELIRAGVSRENRQPRGWPVPPRQVDGYRRKLPAGYKRRRDAEKLAREHFKKIGVEFPGLPEDMNFVKGYKVGKGPANTVFRPAHFHRRSATKKLLREILARARKRVPPAPAEEAQE